MKKIIATVLAAALAVGTITVPASAASDSNKPKTTGLGILPALAGPVALGAGISGPSINIFTLHKSFYFKVWQNWGWQKIHYLKAHDWTVYKKVYGYKVKVHAKKKIPDTNSSAQGQFVVGCIMGSALGAITAAIRKGNAMGNPLRWRSQAEHEAIVKSGYEKQFELTNDEAATALAFCGLGSFALHWQQQAPVVRAGY
jgi:hypothetical protein